MDLQRSVSSFERLGFTKAFENERACLMAAGSARLFLFVPGQASTAAKPRRFDLEQSPPGLDHISFLVDDVDRIYEEMRRKGVRSSRLPPTSRGVLVP